MFRFVVVLACLLAVATAFLPQGAMRASRLQMATPTFGPSKKSAPAPAPAKKAAPAPVKAASSPAKSSSVPKFGGGASKSAAPAKKAAPAPAPVKKAAPAAVKSSSVPKFGGGASKASAPAPAPVKKAAPAPVKKAAAPVKKSSPAPAPFVSSGSFAYGLIGADVEAGEFDPLGFSTQVDQKTVEWYRAAELKHGRVAMAAALGLFFAPTNAKFHWIPDSLFEEQGGINALNKISAERPEAVLQILTALAAVEVLSLFRSPDGAPGDLGWDPLDFKTKYAADQEKLALRELKNGRLAMLMVPGILAQEAVTGKGIFEV
jgi:hypothetical protein